MNPRIGERLPAITPWVLISVALHAGALLWAAQRDWRDWDAPNEHLALEPPRPLDALRLGIESSQAITISWIGFEEPTPHAARPADFDQPALTMDAGATPSAPPPPPPSRVDNAAAAERAQEIAESLERAFDVIGARTEEGVRSVERLGAEAFSAAGQAARPFRSLLEALMRPAPAPTPSREPIANADPAPPVPVPPDAAPDPGASGEPGIESDRESDPASIMDVPVPLRELGRPIAAEGLEIRTVRPRFTHYTRLTVRPADPLIRVRFDRKGRVVTAELVESSGHKDVDNPILDAVYRWTASGKALESLDPASPDATVAIEFRIVL